MDLRIRTASLDSDRPVAIDFYSRHLNAKFDSSWYHWSYCSNPAGPGIGWLVETTDGEVIGAAAAFPRRLYHHRAHVTAWILGNFCIAPSYRTLGAAIRLQRTCLDAALAKEIPFIYDFPSVSMQAIYTRLHLQSSGNMVRLAKLLAADESVRRIVRLPGVSTAIAKAGNVVLKLVDHARAPRHDLQIDLIHTPYDCDFDDLDNSLRAQFDGCICRSSSYLNWRYAENPLRTYETLVARDGGRLAAYAVFHTEGNGAHIVDLVTTPNSAALFPLIHGLSDLLRGRSVSSLSIQILETSPLAPSLRAMSFLRRDTCPIYSLCLTKSGFETKSLTNWHFVEGDRDL